MSKIEAYLQAETKAAPLAVFRILFGLMMCISIIRFWANGWIEKLYIMPDFFFSYYGFEWVRPIGDYTYLLFIICGLASIGVAIGFYYRFSIVVFFLSFSYIELMDKTTYLNHYYFISILSFLMIFLPAAKYFSWDATRSARSESIPKWTIDSIRLLLGIVYFYAGLAKLNSDWLVEAMPLKIWLPGRYDIPFLGDLLHKEWLIYAFSWGGALYDLSIPFLLLWKRTRTAAFVLVVIFHVLTRILFPIGMFPYIMIVSALIFFDAGLHERVITWMKKIFHLKKWERPVIREKKNEWKSSKWKLRIVTVFFVFQLLIPWRYLLYPGELFWTEEGFRFSWRVMLMEKAGYANFKVVDRNSNETFYVDNSDFLTSFQEKQMSFQPDFILEYAHYLRDHFKSKGREVEVYVDSYVALNGRRSRPFIDPKVNLAEEKESLKPKSWILPFEDEIKGL